MKQIVMLLVIGFAATAFAQSYTLGEGTEARFYLDEVLLGSDKTVIGVTPLVTGEFSFDLSDPQTAELGPITIDARDLTTDDNRRDRQIRNRVLASSEDAFQFITFEPTAIEGLPETAAVGDTFEVQIAGNLTIKDVTREEVFTVNLIVAENELQGLGSTIIRHADYGLTIPRVPIVASVADEVKLELDFTATAN